MIHYFNRFFSADKKLRIGVVQFDSYTGVDLIRTNFETTLRSELPLDYEFSHFNAHGNRNIIDALVKVVLKDSFDLIFSIGTIGTLATHRNLLKMHSDIPVVFTDVQDPLRMSIIDSYTHSKTNFTGVILPGDYYEDRLNHLLKLQPFLSKTLVVFDHEQEQAVPTGERSRIKNFFYQHGIAVEEVGIHSKHEVASLVGKALNAYQPQVVFALRHESILAAMPDMILSADHYKVPLYTSDLGSVTAGAAVGCGLQEQALGRKAASKAALLLKQKLSPAHMPLTLHLEPFTLRGNRNGMQRQGLHLSPTGSAWLMQHGDVV